MTEIVTLGLAVPEEAERIARMSRDFIEQGLHWSWTFSRVQRHILDRSCSVVVARSERRLVGFAITRFADETAHLNLLAVRPEWRQQGCGRRLIDWLIASADAAGIRRIDLELRRGNAGARAFYERLGFKAGGERAHYYGGVETALTMSRNLYEPAADRSGEGKAP
ncbi:MAG: GNAT family N-acetyltransferase [Proteobacteria bacterium]|nr:GNAT family N-acetyltransferase [Pseudomonadota bacterium]